MPSRLVTSAVLVLLAAGLAFALWVRRQERTAAFFPRREVDVVPSSAGLAFEEVRFPSRDGTPLHGWFVPGPSPVTLLWLHGNAGNISDRVEPLAAFHRGLGVSSLLFDYRGYGLSEGVPSESGLCDDAAGAFAYLVDVRGLPPSSVVLYGHSLGGALAVDLALGRGRGARGVVLESTFTSAREMARLVYPVLPLGPLLRLRFDSLGRIGSITVPLLVLHGEADDTVPLAMGRRIYDAAPGPKAFLSMPRVGHSDAYLEGGDAYWRAWRTFLDGTRDRREEEGLRP